MRNFSYLYTFPSIKEVSGFDRSEEKSIDNTVHVQKVSHASFPRVWGPTISPRLRRRGMTRKKKELKSTIVTADGKCQRRGPDRRDSYTCQERHWLEVKLNDVNSNENLRRGERYNHLP